MAEPCAQRVDFYVLGERPVDPVLCRLTEKAWRAGHTVFILAQSERHAHHLDSLLWSWRQESFLPHELDGPDAESPVRIGWASEPHEATQVLINLTSEAPPFHARFERVAELVAGDEAQRALARERYRYYRDSGCDVHSHDLQGAP